MPETPTFGRYAEIPYDQMTPEQQDGYRALLEARGALGGPNRMWGEKYPDFMDALVPMASQPSAKSCRNWMMRRLITDSIRNDPDWKNGNYTGQPRSAQFASVFYGIAAAAARWRTRKWRPLVRRPTSCSMNA